MVFLFPLGAIFFGGCDPRCVLRCCLFELFNCSFGFSVCSWGERFYFLSWSLDCFCGFRLWSWSVRICFEVVVSAVG